LFEQVISHLIPNLPAQQQVREIMQAFKSQACLKGKDLKIQPQVGETK